MGEVGQLSDGAKGLPEVEGLGVLQEFIPDVIWLVLSQVPVEEWVIDSNEHGIHGGPSYTVYFPTHNSKTVCIDRMSCRLAVLINGGGDSMVLPKPDPKGPS